MKTFSIKECIDAIETLIPKIMKSIQFTTLKDFFGLSIDLTISQFYVLLAVFRDEGCLMSGLANEMSLSPGTMTGLVDRLEKRSFIKRQHEKADRRAVTVWLTQKGKQFVLEFQKKKDEYLKTVFEKVGKENRQRLVHSLKTFDDAITELLSEKDVVINASMINV